MQLQVISMLDSGANTNRDLTKSSPTRSNETILGVSRLAASSSLSILFNATGFEEGSTALRPGVDRAAGSDSITADGTVSSIESPRAGAGAVRCARVF